MYHVNNGNIEDFVNPYIDKDLDAALDSFDNLFCRRCLVSVKYVLVIFFYQIVQFALFTSSFLLNFSYSSYVVGF